MVAIRIPFLIGCLLGMFSGCVPEAEEPPVTALRLTGGCGEEGTVLFVNADGGRFTLTSDRVGLLIPRRGSLLEAGASLREGEFILSGDACVDAGCASVAFRLCQASRLSNQIDLVCVDGAGAPVCSAHLDEVGVPGPGRGPGADGGWRWN